VAIVLRALEVFLKWKDMIFGELDYWFPAIDVLTD
jgi:hypothetical protein